MQKIDINEATDEQLFEFARNTLGLNLPPHTKPSTVRARISEAWSQPHIVVAEVEEPAAQVGDKPVPVTDEQKPPAPHMIRIQVQEQDGPGGSDPVQVGVNGKVMLIPRGKPVDVPAHYVHVLENAIALRYRETEDGLDPEPRKVQLYPFTVISVAA